MKKLLLILLCLPFMGFGQNVNIPDANFKAYLVGQIGINTNGDSEIQVSEANAFSFNLNVGSLNISDLTGIEAFVNLTEFACYFNYLTSIDLTQNTALTYLNCQGNNLTNLDVSNNTALTYLNCQDNELTNLDVSNNTALTQLRCEYNQLTNLDVSNNTALTQLRCEYNQLTNLDISGATALTTLDCYENQLTNLDVSNNTALISLDCSNNYIECLDISTNTDLSQLKCNDNLLEKLNTKNGNWQSLYVDALNNNLTCVEVENIGVATNDWEFDSFATLTTNCNYTNPCNTVSAIQEHSTNKELLKVTDLLGRETKGTKNQPLFYIYDDGTVEKRITID